MQRSMLSRRNFLRLAGMSGTASGLAALAGCARAIINPGPSHSPSFDLVIFGGTPSGIIAAQAAAAMGARVALIEPTSHVGGIITSGLTVTDALQYSHIGGLAAKFYALIGKHYGKSAPQYEFEPHVAELVFNDFLSNPNIVLYRRVNIASVQIANGRLSSVNLNDGETLSASLWIDSSYEGDLLAAAGITTTVGREASSAYNENLAGWGQGFVVPVSPFQNDGTLIPGVLPNPGELHGQADDHVMAYTYRVCITNHSNNLIPITAPPSYDPATYTGASRYVAALGITTRKGLLSLAPLPHKKFCVENESVFSTDYINNCWSYPSAGSEQRAAIRQACTEFVQGFLYFMTNDPSVPQPIRLEMQTYGLPADEFKDNSSWPYQMYVREARRLVGQYVMTQPDVTTATTKVDTVGVGQYRIDCHCCTQCAWQKSGQPAVFLEGGLFRPEIPFFQLPYGALLPHAGELTNVAASVCISASHIAYASLRLEPTYMILGQAAGTAAALALEGGYGFADVNVPSLQTALIQNGAILYPPAG